MGRTAGGAAGLVRVGAVSTGRRGLAWAGGYVGDGVGTSNLAGRTLADLIRGTSSDLTRLPWVEHRSRNWEPEPLRWLGVNAGLRLMTAPTPPRAGPGARRSERPSSAPDRRLTSALLRPLIRT